ncbi:type II toxin-antitoxin system VapC family toxin [Chroococcidiopsis sp. CCMEE 29]|uniref:type II toxin-antitoxin system VapC family toxin n=1 Tax=Chroococcidiopsis sp. CCMEE 29 TaxID=155894 RepID=UPI00202119C2|nr:type II toxin-antitoxin system VapC family toxin [Chroococcidiopsis sp. CCMEE 29]
MKLFIEQQLSLNDLCLFDIKLDHLAVIATLPLHHRDPFDRLLIAQAVVEGLPIVGVDAAFDAYPVQRLW